MTIELLSFSPGVVGVTLDQRTITILGTASIGLLIALSAFFSSSEIAMFSLADHKVEAMVAEDEPGASLVQRLKDDPHRLLVTILVGNNVVNIAMSSITTTVLAIHLPPAQSVLVATFGITSLVLLFGESAPKSYAVENTESWARRVARPLQLSAYVMYPLVVAFDYLTRQINRLTGTTGQLEAPYITRDELEQLIDTGEREGVLEEGERELLRRVLRFRNRIAKEVMVPRLDVAAVDVAASVTEAIDACIEADRDRLPVYEDTFDEVVGIVDLSALVDAQRRGTDDLRSVTRSPLLVPESKDVDELLQELRAERRTMAIVIDEFGAIQGIVTLEDILEEIVGEILTETERLPIETVDERTIRVRGDVNVHEVNERLGVAIPEGEEFETIAGFVFNRLGRVPDTGEVIEQEGVEVTVDRVEGTRITAITVASFEEPLSEGTDEH